jgi:hypothetical protein
METSPFTPDAGAGPDQRFVWSGQPARPAAVLSAPPPPAPVYSRWRGGETSFGPLGRIGCTVVVLGIAAWLFLVEPLCGVIWTVVACPLALSSIWKRERVS